MPVTWNIEDVGLPTRSGDDDAFRELVEGQRAELHAHCYRMLGSLHDADDALQDTLIRAWRALPRFRGQSSVRTWLYRIATNVCLTAIARRPRRVLPIDYGGPSAGGSTEPALPERTWIEPYPDEALAVSDGMACPEARYERREALELAFVAALQHLPPRQRAVLILRDVLGFSARETAATLDVSQPSVNGALRRARTAIEERVPDESQQAALRSLGDRRLQAVVERFVDSFERGDVGAILALLADDATFSMPPYPQWCQGREEIAQSWLMPSGPAGSLRYVRTRANGQVALGTYRGEPATGAHLPIGLDVLRLRGEQIAEVTAFRVVSAFPRFGLPPRLPR